MKKMFFRYILLILLVFYTTSSSSQWSSNQQPKLVVGIIVDQMRFDHLYKYEDRYGSGGFKRLMREGYNFKNTHYNYTPTVTAAGHASIYTGTTPAVHGIIGNSWFNRYDGATLGNVVDAAEMLVGTSTPNENGASPHNLLTTTISDQMRLGSNFRSKVISVSLKDRGAILPGGHTANAAYWYDWETSPGYFVSSSYYMSKLPDWVQTFNTKDQANNYLNETWNTLYPIDTYKQSASDANRHETSLGGKPSPSFPYEFGQMRERYRKSGAEYQLLMVSPEGNTILTDFALEAIKNEKLGADTNPDLLNISYSVPDVMGHTFGPQSVEIEDMYLRLDQNIETLLNGLDASVGKGNYLVFLSSDHGAIPVASYLKKNKLPADVARITTYRNALTNYFISKYKGGQWIQEFSYENLYLNRKLIAERNLDLRAIQQEAAGFLVEQKGVRSALTGFDLQTQNYDFGIRQLVQKGYHAKRSGDLVLTFDPGVIQNANPEIEVSAVKGTTHGSGYAYDTHVPLLWFGTGVPQGESVRQVAPTDIAPSIAMFLNLQMPSGTTGIPLEELFNN